MHAITFKLAFMVGGDSLDSKQYMVVGDLTCIAIYNIIYIWSI